MSEILIVEDEQDLADGLEINLSKEGYRVLKVTTGDAVMNLVIQKSPDLIILDIVLPDMSGFDVCRELRGQGARSSIHGFSSCRHEDNRRPDPLPPQFPANIQTADARQRRVQDDEMGFFVHSHVQACFTLARPQHLVTFLSEDDVQTVQQFDVVLNDEDLKHLNTSNARDFPGRSNVDEYSITEPGEFRKVRMSDLKRQPHDG